MRREERTVPAGSRVVVELVRPKKARKRRAAGSELRAVARAAGWEARARIAPYDLGTVHQVDSIGGVHISKYTQIHLEADVGFRAVEQVRNRNALIDNLTETTVPSSGREILSPYRFQVSDETAAAATRFEFHQHGKIRHAETIAESARWSPRVPVERRREEIAAELERAGPDSPMRQALLAADERAAREENERWDTISRRRRGREGTVTMPLTDGRWDLGVESLVHYQPFRVWNTEEFNVTESRAASALRVPAVGIEVGPTIAPMTDVCLAPQLHQYTVQWAARYIVGTAFFFELVVWPSTGTFLERLPFWPYAYSYSFAGSIGGNSQALSYLVERTATYHRMIQFDLAVQVFSNLFFIILVDRIGGRIALNYVNIPARTLCAILRTRYGDAPAITRYVWRTQALERPNETFDVQPLHTNEVIGMDILDSDVFDFGGPP